MWERGLKHFQLAEILIGESVAPHVGAWIETFIYERFSLGKMSLPMWERGLKLFGILMILLNISRSPCGSVD